MGMQSSEKAIVLKVGKFREVDAWVRLLGRTRGVFTGFAFGGMRSRRRFPGCLDALNVVSFSLGRSRRGEFVSLEEGALVHSFTEVKKDPAKLGMAVNCLKFAEAAIPGPEDASEVYELLEGSLHLIEQGSVQADLLPFFFRLAVAFAIGFRPELLECCECGGRIGPTAFFNVESGRSVCEACKTNGKAVHGLVRPVPMGALRALDWVGCAPPAQWAELSLSPEVARNFRQLVDLFVAYHLGLQWENGYYKKV